MQRAAALLFALEDSRTYGERVAGRLEWPLSAHEERSFEDGEHKIRPLVDVSRQGYIRCPLSLREPGCQPERQALPAAVLRRRPEGCGRRPRHRGGSLSLLCAQGPAQPARDPITTKYVARLFEACGADAVMTFDVHNRAAFENAFRIPTTNIEAMPLFVEHFAGLLGHDKIAVVSPDIGGAKRAERFRRALAAVVGRSQLPGFVDKQRAGGVVSGDLFVGDVHGRAPILFDDLISTGTTLRRAA